MQPKCGYTRLLLLPTLLILTVGVIYLQEKKNKTDNNTSVTYTQPQNNLGGSANDFIFHQPFSHIMTLIDQR